MLKEELSRREDSVTLQAAIDSLNEDLIVAHALAAMRQAEADAWQTRYQELKPQLAGSAARETELLDNMRQGLVQIASQTTTANGSAAQVRVIRTPPPTVHLLNARLSNSVIALQTSRELFATLLNRSPLSSSEELNSLCCPRCVSTSLLVHTFGYV